MPWLREVVAIAKAAECERRVRQVYTACIGSSRKYVSRYGPESKSTNMKNMLAYRWHFYKRSVLLNSIIPPLLDLFGPSGSRQRVDIPLAVAQSDTKKSSAQLFTKLPLT